MIDLPNLNEYRQNVGICLLNKKGRVWFGKRIGIDDAQPSIDHPWQMPQGGVDKGEEPKDAAIRELYEETGVKTATLLFMTPGWLIYEFPEEYKLRKKRRWQGQRQKWAVMLFTGKESEINLTAHGEQEFCDWRWGEVAELPDLVVPFKKGVYEELLNCLSPMSDFVRGLSQK
ncbi:MAG: RNA pyrophosphohydrolase [Pseudomonadota bacterium]